jgi:MFS family permease
MNFQYISAKPVTILIVGCMIALIGFGVRSTLGLFLQPMTLDLGLDRQTFALALAIQNLLWGCMLPIAGGLADRYGPRWVIASGACMYALGMWGMATSNNSLELQLTAGLLMGIGIAFTAFSLAMATMAKAVGPEKRSLTLGLGTAAGSAGQVIFSPIGFGFISAFGWELALMILAVIVSLIAGFAFLLPTNPTARGEGETNQSLIEALFEAGNHKGFILLGIGFFVCGFQIAFITVHFPSYIIDLGLPGHVGAFCIALVGLFNIVGSFLAGIIGQVRSKKISLANLYFLRSLIILGLLFFPKSEPNLYIFSAAMGLLWLATVPLTTALIAQVFGPRYMATLFGIVFFCHQLGSFLGVWLGGYIFDSTGSYDMVWWLCITFGLIATFLHVLIDEKPLPRLLKSRVADRY